MTTTAAPPRRSDGPRPPQGKLGKWFDERLALAAPMRKQLNKVFPDHWSFMMGEIALYSFIILLLTGTYLTFFFDPSMSETVYHGSYKLMDGVTMSQAYKSTLDITFDRPGGLIPRPPHHRPVLHRARPADPGDPGCPHRGPPGPGRAAEAHPVRRARSHRGL